MLSTCLLHSRRSLLVFVIERGHLLLLSSSFNLMAPLKDKDGQTVAAVRAAKLTPENSAYSHVVV